MKLVIQGACSWLAAFVIVMDHVLLSSGGSFDAPPDLTAMLGPPPKPSWVKYNLECDKSGISTGSSLGMAHGLPAGQIGGIVAGLCVFILLILVALYLFKKREKSLVPKYKVNPQKAAEESNYLYNYRARGKTWGEETPEGTYTVRQPDPFLTQAREKEAHTYLTKQSGGSNASLDTGYNEGAPQGVYTEGEAGYPNDSLPHGGSMSTSSGISLSHSDLNNMGDEQPEPHGHVTTGLSSIRPDLIESTMKAKPVIHRRRQPQPGSLPMLAPIQKQERSQEKNRNRPVDRPIDRPHDRPRRKPRHNPQYEEPSEVEQIAVASFPSPQRTPRSRLPELAARQGRSRGSLTSDPDPRRSGPRKQRRKMPPGYPERSSVEDSV